jgi:hypothetical protein
MPGERSLILCPLIFRLALGLRFPDAFFERPLHIGDELQVDVEVLLRLDVARPPGYLIRVMS